MLSLFTFGDKLIKIDKCVNIPRPICREGALSSKVLLHFSNYFVTRDYSGGRKSALKRAFSGWAYRELERMVSLSHDDGRYVKVFTIRTNTYMLRKCVSSTHPEPFT